MKLQVEVERLKGCSCKPRTTRDLRQPPEARREAWDRSFLGDSQRNQLCPNLDFILLASGTATESMSMILVTQCATLFQQP